MLNISINELVGFDVSYRLPITENSKMTAQINGIYTTKSLTPQDYACEFIRSHFIDVRRIEVINNNNSDETEEIVKINGVEYNQNEFNSLIDEAIDFILFKVERKQKAHNNLSDK